MRYVILVIQDLHQAHGITNYSLIAQGPHLNCSAAINRVEESLTRCLALCIVQISKICKANVSYLYGWHGRLLQVLWHSDHFFV